MVWHAVRWQGLAWLLALGLKVAAFASCDWPLRPTSLLFTPPQFLSHNTASSSSSLRPNATVLKMRVAGKESTILNRTATSKLYIHGELSRSYFCTLGARKMTSTFDLYQQTSRCQLDSLTHVYLKWFTLIGTDSHLFFSSIIFYSNLNQIM